MSEHPGKAYTAGDTGLVSHDVEPPERFAYRIRGVQPDDLWDAEVVEFVTGSEPETLERLRVLADEIRARDATLRLAVLEEAARACRSEDDARAVRDLKCRPSPASTS